MKNKIPSEVDFNRASEAMRWRMRGLDDCRITIMSLTKEFLNLHDVFIFTKNDSSFFVTVIFTSDDDLERFYKSNIITRVNDVIRSAFERIGRYADGATSIIVDYDSHERVVREFKGNYDERFR